jgi:SAM-dependent methyltransferase
VADFLALPLPDNSVDCVYADNVLEHAFDIDATLAEVFRVMEVGGVLIAAIPSDARQPPRSVDNHTWKTAPHDVRTRLGAAGFTGISIEEVDTLRSLHGAPYPPANDKMMYVRAWKVAQRPDLVDLARQLTAWVYGALDPSAPESSPDPYRIIRSGHAWCWGYARVLAHLATQYGLDATMIAMLAQHHARGRGRRGVETHDVVSIEESGRSLVCDPMTNSVLIGSVEDLLRNPEGIAREGSIDERYVQREYRLYDTSYWYARVTRYRRGGAALGTFRIWRHLPDRAISLLGRPVGWHLGPRRLTRPQ